MVSPKASLLLMISTLMPLATANAMDTGNDVVNAFAQAQAGAPLRVSVLGGSITQAGRGWIDPWLQAQFPRSLTSLSNAGMSATGSQLGVFRLERDVLAAQPNLVFIETTVNDEGLSDAETVRSVESLVVRLKSHNPPPAVVILHSANRNGLNKSRHHAVAQHYGLLEIDIDTALKAYLQREKRSWDELMSDAVHPNERGNTFYSEAIATALQPLVLTARTTKPKKASFQLPKRLSRLPLWLDGQLFQLRELVSSTSGWESQANLVDTRTNSPVWWSQFFNGVLASETAGATLEIPFRGTTVGLLNPLQPGFGTLLTSVDGGIPQQIYNGTRDGYESTILARDLVAGEHRLTLVIPSFEGRTPIKLGALLVAGGDGVAGGAMPTQVGRYDAATLRALNFVPLMPFQWRVSGPFGTGQTSASGKFSSDFETAFAPEQSGAQVEWKPAPQKNSETCIIDFASPEQKSKGVFYATTTLESKNSGEALFRISLDYFAKVWLNGREVYTVRDTHGHPRAPLLFPVNLKSGTNHILVKLHPGSGGADFSLAVAKIAS